MGFVSMLRVTRIRPMAAEQEEDEHQHGEPDVGHHGLRLSQFDHLRLN